MIRWLDLKDVGPVRALHIDFAPRLNLLTGDNGLGKSFILDVVWWALTRSWSGEPARPLDDVEWTAQFPSLSHAYTPRRVTKPEIGYVIRGSSGDGEPVSSSYGFSEREWSFPRGRPANPGVVIYARVDGSFSVWDPARNYGRQPLGPGLAEGGASPEPAPYHFNNKDLWEGLREKDGRRPCEGVIRDWVNWQQSSKVEFRTLEEMLRNLSPPGEAIEPAPAMRVSPDDGFDTPCIKASFGVVPLTHASAGVRRIIGLAYLLVWAWREHQLASRLRKWNPEHRIVLLIDEPETHLHPKWQRAIVPAILRAAASLLRTSEGPGSLSIPPAPSGTSPETQVLAATHSPLILASLEPSFDAAQDALTDLDLKQTSAGREIEARRVTFRRLGDASAWLTSEVFDLKSARSSEAEALIERASEAMKSPSFGRDAALEIDEGLRKVLGDSDSFWIRWRFLGEQRGWLK